MADNLEVTAGTGTTIATDQVGTTHYQRVKISDGTADSENHLVIDSSGNAMAKLAAGTNAIGKLAANSGVDIGDVDVLSSALPTGASTAANQSTIIGHVDGIETLLGTMDTDTSALAGAVSGTEVQVDVVASLPAGTNTIGKVAPNEYELAGNTTHVKKYYTYSGAVTDGIVWSPAAGKRWYVTDLIINVSAAATVTLEDDLGAGDSAVFKAELAANSGISHSFNTPLYSGEDAADLLITTSAGNVYVCVTGYEI